MKAGEGLAFPCSYQNTTDKALRFGTSATDEMCILFGLSWEAYEGQEVVPQGCDVTWVDAAVDPECRAALECLGACSGEHCGQSCIDPHSSALGLLAQMQNCIDYRCTACSAQSAD